MKKQKKPVNVFKRRKSSRPAPKKPAAKQAAPKKPVPVKKERKPAPRQESLPGLEDKRIEEISLAAIEHQANREDLKLAKEACDSSKEILVGLMKKHGLKRYSDRKTGIYVETDQPDAKVKVMVLEDREIERRDEVEARETKPIGEDILNIQPTVHPHEQGEDGEEKVTATVSVNGGEPVPLEDTHAVTEALKPVIENVNRDLITHHPKPAKKQKTAELVS